MKTEVLLVAALVSPQAAWPETPDAIAEKMKSFSSWIEVDLDAIGFNLEQIRKHTGAEVMPVVKNNAYGHGLVPVVDYLQRQGVKRVFVADLREAFEIRAAGLDVGIVNMGPVFSEADYRKVVELSITQTIFDAEAAQALSHAAVEAGEDASVFVKVDTGLRRVGVWHERAADFIEEAASLPRIRIDGIFSTLQQVREQDRLQLAHLLAVDAELTRRGIPHGVRSLSSSDAIFHFEEAHLDLVRPGMSLYGIYPEPKDRDAGVPLRQALSFKARIEQVKWVNEGDSVTYWGRFIAPSRMMLGTVHVGFYQVLPRELANKGVVLYQGAARNMVGSVSLNHVIIDLTGTSAQVGDAVEVIGREGENSAFAVAERAGWMVYSLLNHLSPSTPRVFYEGGRPVTLVASGASGE